MYTYLVDPADVREREIQRVDGHVALIERRVFGVDVKGDGVWVGEREGPLRPADAHERNGRPEGLAPECYFPPPTTDVADSDPMRRTDGAVLGEASGGVKVVVKRMNGRGIAAEEERKVAHNLGEYFGREEGNRMWLLIRCTNG